MDGEKLTIFSQRNPFQRLFDQRGPLLDIALLACRARKFGRSLPIAPGLCRRLMLCVHFSSQDASHTLEIPSIINSHWQRTAK